MRRNKKKQKWNINVNKNKAKFGKKKDDASIVAVDLKQDKNVLTTEVVELVIIVKFATERTMMSKAISAYSRLDAGIFLQLIERNTPQ